MRKHRKASLIGAGIGLAMFLVFGMLPALVYGGYAGLLLAGGIFGRPVDPTLLARGLIVFGMILGVTAVASMFAVGGAAVGALFGAVTQRVSETPVASKPTEAIARKDG